MSLIIKKITVGPLDTNCYILSCEYTGHTFIIDPGDNPKAILDYLHRNEFIPKSIVLTHGHPDHIGAVKILSGELGVSFMIHPNDAKMVKEIFNYCRNTGGKEKHLVDREFLELGREKLNVIHTPGHTPGSVCILGEGILFSGDTLFKGGVGRTDLPGGSNKELENSLRNKIFILPLNTIVYPGHGPETTVGEEVGIISGYF